MGSVDWDSLFTLYFSVEAIAEAARNFVLDPVRDELDHIFGPVQNSFAVCARLEVSLHPRAQLRDNVVVGDLAYDYGWHEFTLRPKGSEDTLHKRHRYLEVWRKNSSGQWRIASFINNADVREEFDGHTSHWFLSEEHGTDARDPVR